MLSYIFYFEHFRTFLSSPFLHSYDSSIIPPVIFPGVFSTSPPFQRSEHPLPHVSSRFHSYNFSLNFFSISDREPKSIMDPVAAEFEELARSGREEGMRELPRIKSTGVLGYAQLEGKIEKNCVDGYYCINI